MIHKKTFVLLSYDWRNLFKTDPNAVREKLLRDHLDPTTHRFFFVSWSTEAYEMDLEEHISTVHMKGRFKNLRPLYDFLLSNKLERILEAHQVKPDAIIAYDLGMVYTAQRYAEKHGIPIMLFITNLPDTLLLTRKHGWVRHAYQQMLERWCAASVTHAFVISEATQHYAEKIGIAQEKIHRFVPDTISIHGEERKVTQKGMVRKKYGIAPDKQILLSVGRLEPEKGFDRLLEAFAHIDHNDLALMIVGDGVLRGALEQQAEVLGIKQSVYFVGTVPHGELWSYYADCAMFVLFSRSEALGLVVWEAMNMGTPVIGSHAEGIIESIGKDSERGFLWDESEGYDVLERYIQNIIDQKQETIEKITRAKKYVTEKLTQRQAPADFL